MTRGEIYFTVGRSKYSFGRKSKEIIIQRRKKSPWNQTNKYIENTHVFGVNYIVKCARNKSLLICLISASYFFARVINIAKKMAKK